MCLPIVCISLKKKSCTLNISALRDLDSKVKTLYPLAVVKILLENTLTLVQLMYRYACMYSHMHHGVGLTSIVMIIKLRPYHLPISRYIQT